MGDATITGEGGNQSMAGWRAIFPQYQKPPSQSPGAHARTPPGGARAPRNGRPRRSRDSAMHFLGGAIGRAAERGAGGAAHGTVGMAVIGASAGRQQVGGGEARR